MDDPDDHFQIVLLYNDDSEVARDNPQDILAIQYTVTTAQCIFEALSDLGYAVQKIAVRGDLGALEDILCSYSPKNTFIFNNCDGFNGDNMGAVEIIRLVERLGFKHTGATAEGAALCISKPRSKGRLLQWGIPTPPYQVFERPEGECRLAYPLIVKPSIEDASMGIELDSVVCEACNLFPRIEYIIEKYHQPAMVEEFIVGRELAVAVLGNGHLEVLPIAEDDYSLIPNPLQRLLTYESKWEPDSFYYQNIPTRVPASLSRREEEMICKVAKASFRAMGLRDLGRMDIRLRDGVPYVIDVNEIPDLSPDAGFWNSARAAGYTYSQMIGRILAHALKREGWIR